MLATKMMFHLLNVDNSCNFAVYIRFSGLANVHTGTDNMNAVSGADVIIVLAVKPWLIESVCRQIAPGIDFTRQLILSVAANVFTDSMQTFFGCEAAKLCYVMPM